MRRSLLLPALALLLVACAAGPPDARAAAAVGETAPGFSLLDLQGATHSLDQYRGSLVVLEWINPNCPFSERHAREKTMTGLAGAEDLVWLAINSTNPDHRDHLEPAEHLAYNREVGISYPVLYDPSGEVGRAYGARTTPQMVLVDPAGTILYNGAIDDDPSGRSAAAERTNYLALALAAARAGATPDPATTQPYGCSVKY